MQSDWTTNDNEWKLKKLQHDSLKTVEKSVDSLRETIEKEVLNTAKEYERLFGPRSAQFTEYLTMVAQKMEMHGVHLPEITNWLVSVASEGSVKNTSAIDRRDSQSQTVPLIDGGPMMDFGEQSLLDRSLGTLGVGSPRPGLPGHQAVTSPYPVWGEDSGPSAGNTGHATGNGQNPPPSPLAAAPPSPAPVAAIAPSPLAPPAASSAPALPPPTPLNIAPVLSVPALAAPNAQPKAGGPAHIGPVAGHKPTPVMKSWGESVTQTLDYEEPIDPIVPDMDSLHPVQAHGQTWELPLPVLPPGLPQAQVQAPPQPVAPSAPSWESPQAIGAATAAWEPPQANIPITAAWEPPQANIPISAAWETTQPIMPGGAGWEASQPVRLEMAGWESQQPVSPNMPIVQEPTAAPLQQPQPYAQPPIAAAIPAPMPAPIPTPMPGSMPLPAQHPPAPAAPASVPMPVRSATQQNMPSFSLPGLPPHPPSQANMPQPNFNHPQPNINQPQPNINQPQPNFNQPQPNINQPQPNFNQPQPNINQPQPNFNQQQPNFNQPQPGYNQGMSPYNQPGAMPPPQPNQYGAQPPNKNNEDEPTYDPSTAWG